MQIEAAIFIASSTMAPGVQIRKPGQRLGGCMGIRPPAANGGHPVVRLDHIAIA